MRSKTKNEVQIFTTNVLSGHDFSNFFISNYYKLGIKISARAGKNISLGGKSIARFKSFEVRIQYNKDVFIMPEPGSLGDGAEIFQPREDSLPNATRRKRVSIWWILLNYSKFISIISSVI